MKIYLIRHAHAEERHFFAQTGKHDDQRPLTEKGIDRMNKIIQSFKGNEENINLFLQSPLKRAKQTGEVLKDYYPEAQFVTTKNLVPGFNAKKLYDEIQSYELDSLGIIGHEPDLGQFLSWMLFRQATDHFPLKKGGIAKLDLYKDGRCYLKWLIRPKLLIP